MTNRVFFASWSSRLRPALQAAGFHWIASALVTGLVGALVFGFWYREPWRQVMGGTELFWLIVGVDVVCGPLLMLVIFNPLKKRAELWRDIAIVVGIQVFALGYGLHTLSFGRPLAVVYEVDRFRVVSYADLDESDIQNAPPWVSAWGWDQPRLMGTRQASSIAEKFASVDASLQGVEPSQRPSWWQDYALNVPQVLQRAKKLPALRVKQPTHQDEIDRAAAKAIADQQAGETKSADELLWLPLVSRRTMEWVALIDPTTARIRGYAHLDGF